MISNSNYETNFPQKLLLTDKHVSVLHGAFVNNTLANIKLSKTQLSKIVETGELLRRLLRPIL